MLFLRLGDGPWRNDDNTFIGSVAKLATLLLFEAEFQQHAYLDLLNRQFVCVKVINCKRLLLYLK